MKNTVSITEKPAVELSGGYGKVQLLVSFSGGETSAYMAQWLWKNMREKFDMIFVFANTGQENEETLWYFRKNEFRMDET